MKTVYELAEKYEIDEYPYKKGYTILSTKEGILEQFEKYDWSKSSDGVGMLFYMSTNYSSEQCVISIEKCLFSREGELYD